jgi:penicillin G amidase
LERPVRVLRDRLGVPHVYARSDHDALFMNGYLQAQDRFFQMRLSRNWGCRPARLRPCRDGA